jgi:hypothetical protein
VADPETHTHELIANVTDDAVLSGFYRIPRRSHPEITDDLSAWTDLEPALAVSLEELHAVSSIVPKGQLHPLAYHREHIKVRVSTCSPKVWAEGFALGRMVVQEPEDRLRVAIPLIYRTGGECLSVQTQSVGKAFHHSDGQSGLESDPVCLNQRGRTAGLQT